MTQPSKLDIKKRQEKLDKLLKGLNEDGSFSIITKNISTGEIVSVDMTLKEE